jgi:hypothetical protein
MDDLMADDLRTNQDGTETSQREVLLDTAQNHLQEGEPDRAIAIWQQLIGEDDEGADDARLDYADHLFGQLRDDEAWTELAAIMASGRIFSTAWLSAAELIEEQGELATALAWFSLSTESLTPQDVSGSTGPFWAADLAAGRRRVKWAMGIPLDDFDLLGDVGDVEAEDKGDDLLALLAKPLVIEGRIQAWDRSEFKAAQRWCRSQIAAEDAYYREVERALRAQDGRASVILWTFGSWLERVDALEAARSREEVDQLTARYDEGSSVVWPPPRNQPCWCGSRAKYKKCCGSNAA